MIQINMAVTASSHAELLEALQAAGPNVTTFYGEVVPGEKTEVSLTKKEPVVVSPELPDSYAPADEPAPKPERVYDITEVRAALAAVREMAGTEEMRSILRKYGAEKLPDLDTAHYAAVMAEADKCLQTDTPS